ncbi:histidine phosphatase family protein [Actinoplanes sp. L3-i22]|uniref:histidine phosphatase family protein n=1 Tax=Actinoplanes sp. L3-i22 TaxID=2836373 RepID=UPI001C75122A|nr:histidine phosphatase family protein [Actinoplanes sp. L3-i22]BCY06754.1 phosphoglycerate mutase [Actinoplanes sp. L3-i22]
MATVAELILIRHGQSLANVLFPEADAQELLEVALSGRDADVPLTDLGQQQARAVGAWLAALPGDQRPETIVTSPYLRAKETWRLAAEASGLATPEPRTDDRLVDRLLGELEMMTRAAIAARYPEEAERLSESGMWEYRPPGGESFADIRVRLTAFLDDLHREHADRRVVVVAHDAVVLMTRAVLEDLDWAELAALEQAEGSVRNASISRFVNDGNSLKLDRYNVIDHLPPA